MKSLVALESNIFTYSTLKVVRISIRAVGLYRPTYNCLLSQTFQTVHDIAAIVSNYIPLCFIFAVVPMQ